MFAGGPAIRPPGAVEMCGDGLRQLVLGKRDDRQEREIERRAQPGGSETPPSPGRTSPDDERKRQFLKAREEMKTVPATPAPVSPAPRPKPRPRVTPTPEPATPRPVTPRPESPKPNPATRSVS